MWQVVASRPVKHAGDLPPAVEARAHEIHADRDRLTKGRRLGRPGTARPGATRLEPTEGAAGRSSPKVTIREF